MRLPKEFERVVDALNEFNIPTKLISKYVGHIPEAVIIDYLTAKKSRDPTSRLSEQEIVESAVYRMAVTGSHQAALAWLKYKGDWNDETLKSKSMEKIPLISEIKITLAEPPKTTDESGNSE